MTETETAPELDIVPMIREVMFVGEHFTLMTSIALDETLRGDGEADDDFAIRLASEGFKGFYGWDVKSHSIDVGVLVE